MSKHPRQDQPPLCDLVRRYTLTEAGWAAAREAEAAIDAGELEPLEGTS